MDKSPICTLLIVLAMPLGGFAPTNLYRSHLLDDQGDSNNPGVFITWLGTAGVLVSDGRTGLLIDPYVSRFSLSKVFLGSALHPGQDLIRQWVKRLGASNIHAVIVSHSHFDHALDAPYFALETGVPLLGSESTLNIGRGVCLPEKQLIVVQPGRAISIGDFSITVIESRHGSALFGRVPFPGTIDHPLTPPRPARDYKLGTTYAILIKHPSGTILHHGSAGFLPDMYAGIQADVVLLGIAGRGDTKAYLAEVPLKVKSRVVIPIHFDDFFKPLEEGLSFLYTGHFAEFCATAEKSSCVIKTPPLGKQVRILTIEP
jgi:L-ascorbate metabolism protein UlaG (beta-lactamase superfamily)